MFFCVVKYIWLALMGPVGPVGPRPSRFCEAIWMYAAFCEGRERGSALNVLDRVNDEQGAADAEWRSKKTPGGFTPPSVLQQC